LFGALAIIGTLGFRVGCRFGLEIGRARPKATRGSAKPDEGRIGSADNLLKIAADALRGIVLGDDASYATVRKRYSDDPRLRIEVREFA
jgi:Holliday junction resolvase RusA-like endonuclease